jgi:alkylation response protein AidB-like acyl-CoA dehydrogenase
LSFGAKRSAVLPIAAEHRPFHFCRSTARISGCCARRGKGDQIKKYFIPYAKGANKVAIAITEPAAGSDPANMQMRAEYKNEKVGAERSDDFISGARKADFIIAMAVTDPRHFSVKARPLPRLRRVERPGTATVWQLSRRSLDDA